MKSAGNIDYAGMSNAELIQCLQNVDPRRFPENIDRIVAEMRRRGLDSLVAPYLRPSAREPAIPAAPENVHETEIVWVRKSGGEVESDARRKRTELRGPAWLALGCYFVIETGHALGWRGKGRDFEPRISFVEYLDNLLRHWYFLLGGFVVVFVVRYVLITKYTGGEAAICNQCFESSHPRRISQACSCGGMFEDVSLWKPEAVTTRRTVDGSRD